MRLSVDAETTGLLEDGLDYSQLPYRLKPDYRVHLITAVDLDTGQSYAFFEEPLEGRTPSGNFEDFKTMVLDKVTYMALHNGIGFDLLMMRLYFGWDYEVNSEDYKKSKWCGKEIALVDTMVLSRFLNPDRKGHSLAWWGEFLGNRKEDYQGGWSTFNVDMLDYGIQDTVVTKDVHDYLLKVEWGTWDNARAFSEEQYVNYLESVYSHVGFAFNTKAAEEAVEWLEVEMERIRKHVEPQLPLRAMTKSEASEYTLPSTQIKKDGTLGTHMVNWIERHGAKVVEDDYGDMTLEVYGQSIKLPHNTKEPILKRLPMRMNNQSQMKQYLVYLGWEPTVWAENDLTVDSKKTKVTFGQFKAAITRYCKETASSHFKKYRLEYLKVKDVNEMFDKLIHSSLERPLRVITSPKYTVDNDKNICPNLLRLGDKVEWVTDVVKYLTYTHRRNSIKSPKGSGWLHDARVQEHGVIGTPAIVTSTNTYRMSHIKVANIPRVSSIFGKEMRQLFGVPEDCYQLGCDGSGLEARVQGHYCYRYTGGVDYAQVLMAEKPNDIHTVNARKWGISRDDAKSTAYGVMYGAQPPKLAKMLGLTLKGGKELYNEFWDSQIALKELKAKVEAFWEKTGNSFLKGIDNRKIFTRSKHSLLNALFQSCGSILMKKAWVLQTKRMMELGIWLDPFKDSSWEGKCHIAILYHDECQLIAHKSLVEVFESEPKEDEKAFLQRVGHNVTSGVTHVGDKLWAGKSIAGEIMQNSIRQAAVDLKMNLDFDGEYLIGLNWAHCH